MESSPSRALSIPACSFKCTQHPDSEAMKAECEPWLLALTMPPSAAAARFWQGQLLPLLGSFMFAPCTRKRAVLATKMLIWFTVSDTSDDDVAVRGSSVTDHVHQRHHLILSCFAGEPLQCASLMQLAQSPGGADIIRELSALHDIWKDISTDMSLRMRARYLDAVSRYLHALRVQAQYRSVDALPGVDEYLNVVSRPASLGLQMIILLEYALDIELDEETLGSELLLRLQDAVIGHVVLYNDLFSYEAEIFSGDYFNLASVILRERVVGQPGFTLADALQEAARMAEEMDKLCVQLMQEVGKSSLVKKPGMEAYLRGLECFMAGVVEWSFKTARYTHTCTTEGLVLPVERATVSLITSAAPAPDPPTPMGGLQAIEEVNNIDLIS